MGSLNCGQNAVTVTNTGTKLASDQVSIAERRSPAAEWTCQHCRPGQHRSPVRSNFCSRKRLKFLHLQPSESSPNFRRHGKSAPPHYHKLSTFSLTTTPASHHRGAHLIAGTAMYRSSSPHSAKTRQGDSAFHQRMAMPRTFSSNDKQDDQIIRH